MEMYWKIENVNQCPVGDMKQAGGGVKKTRYNWGNYIMKNEKS